LSTPSIFNFALARNPPHTMLGVQCVLHLFRKLQHLFGVAAGSRGFGARQSLALQPVEISRCQSVEGRDQRTSVH
jgi:hypothetical protein